jgi:hypothetical protein
MAWTITPTIDKVAMVNHQLGDEIIRVKLECESDSGDSDFDLMAAALGNGTFADVLRGSWLYLVKFVPGTASDVPDAAFDLDIEDDNDDHLLDTDDNTHTANSFVIGADTLGVSPPIIDACSVVIGTLGDGNLADIYLYFLK